MGLVIVLVVGMRYHSRVINSYDASFPSSEGFSLGPVVVIPAVFFAE